jgi:membrane protein implicated in regulation of membrane protease activity
MPTLVRYLLLQVPGWVLLPAALLLLRRFVEVPLGAVVGVTLAWVAKDLLLYRLVKPAYAVDERTEVEKLVGTTAVVRRPLEPVGWVELRGELWRAEAARGEGLPIPAGSRVRVDDSRGLSLVVARAE